jgi:P-type Cu2+ transporter
MNTHAMPATALQADAAAGCFHCGLPLRGANDYKVFVNGAERDMCCAGCAAVAETIVAGGLADYYHHRSVPGNRPEDSMPQWMRDLESFDLEAVQQSFVQRSDGGACRAELLLEGVNCPACVWLVEQRLKRLPGVSEVSVNYATQRVRIGWADAQVRLSSILRTVADVGLRAHPFDAAHRSALRQKDKRRRLFELALAALGMMQVMMYAVPVYLSDAGDIAPEFEKLMRWASLLLTLPVVLVSARSFFSGAWRDLAHRRIGMDVPIALAIASAFGASVWATVAGHGEVYFDSLTMFVFLLLGARYLEAESRTRAVAAIERLSHPLPATAACVPRYPDSKETRMMASAALVPGDTVLIDSGSAIPADGTIMEGTSEVNEALLSGEARPIPKRAGDAVVGGTLNVGSPLFVCISHVGADTVLAHIVRLADRALGEKPRFSQLADRIAGSFSLAVLILAAITALAWLSAGGELWFRNAISVLVVTCPCALALATPAAIAAATGRLSAIGLLATRGHVLETFARVTDVVFDKTGTLTQNEMSMARIVPLGKLREEAIVRLAAELELGSGHPVARALTGAARDAPGMLAACATKLTHSAGQGVEGEIGGERLRIGTAAFVGALVGKPLGQSKFPEHTHSQVLLGRSGEWLARIDLDDAPRPDAREALDALRAAGARIHVLSGDVPAAVNAIARELCLSEADNVQARATPQHKLEYVEALQRKGRVVAMVGDGINDAPVLAQAALSIAMGSGTDLARANADMVLLSGRLMALAEGLAIARMTRRVIGQNVAWAIVYNAIAVPLAMMGWISPWAAALGMSASSLLVVGNAARLQRGGSKG